MNELTVITPEAFVQAIQRGLDAFNEAGRILVALLDQDPDVKEKIVAAFPQINSAMLTTFENIGRGRIDHRLAFDSGSGVRALEKCPLSVQQAAIENGVELLTATGETLRVQVQDLVKEQVSQVFDSGKIRSLGAQRAWLESRKTAKAIATVETPYRIGRGKITFTAPCTMSAAELMRLAAEASEGGPR